MLRTALLRRTGGEARRCKIGTLRGFFRVAAKDWQFVMLRSRVRNVRIDTVT
jgi:hypothetical protein